MVHHGRGSIPPWTLHLPDPLEDHDYGGKTSQGRRCQMVPILSNFAHRIRCFWSIQSFERYLGAAGGVPKIFTTLAAKVPSLQFLTGGGEDM